jgi:hypothetical protein
MAGPKKTPCTPGSARHAQGTETEERREEETDPNTERKEGGEAVKEGRQARGLCLDCQGFLLHKPCPWGTVSLSSVAQRVSGAKQFSVHQTKGLRVAYLCRIARHEAQSVPSLIKGSRETARTTSTRAGTLSSFLRRAWWPAASGTPCTSYTVPGHDRCDTRRPAAAARLS